MICYVSRKEIKLNKFVYKSESGKVIVEDRYKDILEGFASLNFSRLYVDTTYGSTHVLKFGDDSKPALIMLHGTMSNSASWLGDVDKFTDDFTVYCVDLPGEPGLSAPNRIILNSDDPFMWMDSLIKALGIDKFSLLTMSLGSWFGLNYAVYKPKKVTAMSIITTGGIAPQKVSFIFKALLFLMLGKKGQKLLNRAIAHNTVVPEEVIEYQALVSKHFKPLTEPLPLFSDAELKNLRLPVQYFGGDHDAILDTYKTVKRLETYLPNAEVNLLSDTGHVIINQFEKIKKFLVDNS